MKYPLLIGLAMLVFVLALATPYVHALNLSNISQWAIYNANVTNLLIYNFSNNSMGVLALPNYIIENYAVINSPYPLASFYGVLYMNNTEYLVLGNGDTYSLYYGVKFVKQYTLGYGTPILDYTFTSLASGNKVLYNSSVYTFPAPVYPLAIYNGLYGAYIENGYIHVTSPTNDTNLSAPAMGVTSILGFYMSLGNAYVLGSTQNSTLLVVISPNDSSQYFAYNIKINKVITANVNLTTSQVEFFATSNNILYRITTRGAIPIANGRILDYDGQYIYIYNSLQNTVYVYNSFLGYTQYNITLPKGANPQLFASKYPYTAFYSNGKLYVASLLPPVSAVLLAPEVVYAGHTFTYKVIAYNAVAESLTFNGEPIPTSGELNIGSAGNYTFTLYATNGVVTIQRNYTITVIPNFLSINVNISEPTVAYSTVKALINAYSDGQKVYTACLVSYNGKEMQVSSGYPFNLQLIPRNLSDNYILLTITCGNNSYFSKVTSQYYILLQKATPTLHVSYLGAGHLLVSFYTPDNTSTVGGSVTVYLNNTRIGVWEAPFVFNLTYGLNNLEFIFVPNTTLFSVSYYYLTATYFENLSQVPKNETSQVIVADLIQGTNVSQTKTVTQTITEPVQVPVEIKVLNIDMLIPIAVGVFIAGLAIGAILKRGRKANQETPENTENNDAGVEFENA